MHVITSITPSVLIRFLKVADKMDMDEILDKFENWPDQIINLSITSSWLLKKPLFGFVISITHSVLIETSSDVDMDEISKKLKN